jgi:hypothetical protein
MYLCNASICFSVKRGAANATEEINKATDKKMPPGSEKRMRGRVLFTDIIELENGSNDFTKYNEINQEKSYERPEC